MPVDFPYFRHQVVRSARYWDPECRYRTPQKLNWALNFTNRGCSTELGRSHVVVVVENASL